MDLKIDFKYVAVALAVFALIFAAWSYASTPRIGPLNSAHWHAEWTVSIEGEPVFLQDRKYQLRDKFVHMESGESTIHKHATGVTMGYFLKTLGWKFSLDCLQLDYGSAYCNDGQKQVKFLVNGKANSDFDRYDIKDGDTIEIKYE